jgi:hypothetical protein
MMPDLGLVDARFGRIWSEEERSYVVSTLAAAGYNFYHYGPKADRALRRDWRQTHSAGQTAMLTRLSAEVRATGMRFGIALTPVGSTHPFDDQARADLARRVADLDAIGVDDLAIFFDDLRGDMPDLAARQAEVVNFCAGLTKATSVYTCPTYYADDRILDVVFGSGPPTIWPIWAACSRPTCRSTGPARRSAPAPSAPRIWPAWRASWGARSACGTIIRSMTVRACRASCICAR